MFDFTLWTYVGLVLSMFVFVAVVALAMAYSGSEEKV